MKAVAAALVAAALDCASGLQIGLGTFDGARTSSLRCAIGDVPKGFLGEEQLGDWVKLPKSTNLGASSTVKMPEPALALMAKIGEGEDVAFGDVISMIEENFDVTPTAFAVGDVESASGENMGSSKILGLGRLMGLSEQETLSLFGQYYKDVCANPDGDDHPNIRAFMKGGWGCVNFPWGVSVSVPVDGKAFDTSAQSVADALAASSAISGEMEWDQDSDIWIP